MEIEIALSSKSKTLQEVKESLEKETEFAASDLQLELRSPKRKFRGIDPTILVAVVGAAGTGLGALITGLLQVGQQLAARKIVLEAGDQKLEVPASTPPEQIDRLLDKLSDLSQVKKISVS